MSKIELAPHYQERDLQEACGIAAIFSKKKEILTPRLSTIARKLEHRGRDATGIAAFDGEIIVYKGLGKPADVFPDSFDFETHNLNADRGIGHVRYGTSGDNKKDDSVGAQPMVAEWDGRYIAIAYNGNLPDSQRQKLKERIPLDMPQGPNFDTVDIARAIVSAQGETWEEKIKNGLEGIHMAYALTILTDEGDIYGLVCPSGTWPLWVGENKDTIIFASETRVVDKKENIKWRPVKPGELVKAAPEGVVSKQIFTEGKPFRCALHDAYGAKFDSQITENITYGEFRQQLGRNLAREHPIEADIYAGIPETGIDIVQGYTSELGKIPASLITRRDQRRSFIGKDEEEINAVVNGKYEILHAQRVKGKRVELFDDSLIRGKTTGGDSLNGVKGVIGLVREAGAIHVGINLTLKKFIKGCDMGYYIRENQLVALVRQEDGTYEELSEREIADRIGADTVYYLSQEGIENTYEWAFGKKDITCMACMGDTHPLKILSEKDGLKFEKEETTQPILVYSAEPCFVTPVYVV